MDEAAEAVEKLRRFYLALRMNPNSDPFTPYGKRFKRRFFYVCKVQWRAYTEPTGLSDVEDEEFWDFENEESFEESLYLYCFIN